MAQTNRRDALEKEKAVHLGKDYSKNNSLLSLEHIGELFDLFALYADPRSRKSDVRDILMTARTLGLDAKYQVVFRALEDVADARKTEVDFETFIKDLTAKLGGPQDESSRHATFALLDQHGKGELDFEDMKFVNEQLRYGFKDDQLKEIITSVGGANATTITADKFNRYIAKRVEHRRKMFG